MKKAFKGMLSFSKLLAAVSILLSFFGFLLEAATYTGFFEKHFYVNPWNAFWGFLVVNYFLIVIDKRNNYWWKRGVLRLLQTQSKWILPVFVVIYVLLVYSESVHYPNYVFSEYHINFPSILNVVYLELFLFFLPRIAVIEETYVRLVSRETGWKQGATGIWLFILIVISLLVSYNVGFLFQ